MTELNIIYNAKRNIFFGIINKIILMICPFIERTVIQYILGAQYLGINSLFSSILSVLSLAELGFGTAIVYHMYKPVSTGDTETVNALLNLYRRMYRIMGIVILFIGLLIMPILKNFINGTYPENINIYVLYLIFLINSSLSYFMYAYVSSLLVVYQRSDLSSMCNSIVRVMLLLVQVTVMFVSHNYYIFLVMMPIFTVVNNIWMRQITKKHFPQYECKGAISTEKMKEIRELVVGTFIQKISATTRNSLDSICVSAFLGLTLTAIYCNYLYIYSAITSVLLIVSNSLTGGIGNHVAVRTVKENYNELCKIDFLYLLISGECSICLLCLTQPFMELWMGKDMMLPLPIVVLLTLFFYELKLGDMRSMYMAACGTWWSQRYVSVAESIINLGLNILLGKFFGIYGIVIATIISLLVCNVFGSTIILFRAYFGKDRIVDHYLRQMKITAVSIIVSLITYAICSFCGTFNSGVVTFFVRACICVVVPSIMYYFMLRNVPEMKYAIKRLLPSMHFKKK